MTDEYKQWLESFWTQYVHAEMYSSSTTQVFARGPYAGYSIRELMETCVRGLGYKMPKIINDNYN